MESVGSDSEQRAHAYARTHGLSRPVYASARAVASAALRLWFRIRIAGTEQIPAEGPAIVAPNHKNFLDAFFVGVATRRQVHYMTKIELFKGPLEWLLPRLGAFPVRRGEADAEALATARALLAAGELVVIFPEGTRVERPDVLGSPHHGAGRLALETGAPIVPAAITGTSRLWRGALPQLRRVQLAFLPPVRPREPSGQDAGAQLIDELVWPAVQAEYGRLRATPGLIAAALAAAGIGGGLLTRRRRRARWRPRPVGQAEPLRPLQPQLLGKVEPRKLRRRKARARLRVRLGLPRLRHPRLGHHRLGLTRLRHPHLGHHRLGLTRLRHPRLGDPRLGHPRLGHPRLGDPRLGHARLGHPHPCHPRFGHLLPGRRRPSSRRRRSSKRKR